MPGLRRPQTGGERHLLVLDAAYTIDAVRSRRLEPAVTARDLGGYFDHVWSVHPLAGADPAERAASVGAIWSVQLAARHTMLEVPVGRWQWLRRLPALNLLAAQLGLLRRVAHIVRRNPVAAVRVGDPYYQGLLGLLIARVARLPLVIRVNGNHDAIYESTGTLAYPRLFRRRSVEKRIDRFVLPRAALVLAPNDDNLAFAIRNGADPARTATVRYGSLIHPVHRSEPASRPPVRAAAGIGHGPVLAAVTRLEPVKHPDVVVMVLERVRRQVADATAVVVGDGSMRSTLEQLAADLELTGSLTLAGNRDQEWIASLLAESSVVVAPMMGRALVEAALSGRPIVAFDVDWHAELLSDGETGILVPFGDTDAMADAVAGLLLDPDRADAIGARGRATALDQMDPDRIVDVERAQYQRLLAVSERADTV